MTSRGRTYVTVGSHGIYYRETLSSRDMGRGVRPHTPSPKFQASLTEDTIVSAGSSELIDSSSERLIQQLNERARMFNPAWIFYAAGLISLFGLGLVPSVPTIPNLPEVTLPSAERSSNAVDEYSTLAARYGQPNTIVYSEASPLAPVPVGTAQYEAAHVSVVFVPVGCVDEYSQIVTLLANASHSPSKLKSALKRVPRCVPSPRSSWTIVGYIDSADNAALTGAGATVRLNSIPEKQSATPRIEFQSDFEKNRHLDSLKSTKFSAKGRPEMKSDENDRVEAERLAENIKDAKMQALLASTAPPLLAMALIIAGAIVHRKNSSKRETHLVFELDQPERERHRQLSESLEALSKCQKIWRVEASSATWDWKRNAGASSLIQRSIVSIRDLSPPRVKINARITAIDFGRSQLYFFPDMILYRDGRGYGGIGYKDFGVTQGITRFIEGESVPSDSMVIDHTWQYVNKNGGPDRRFNNNRRLPVLQLGVLVFTSSKGLNIRLNTSNAERSAAFAESWRTQFQGDQTPQKPREQSQHPPSQSAAQDTEEAAARKMLGVSGSASGAEISAAYHKLARMYHPDRIAGLAPEFQAVADKRMKEINAAYELLK